MRFWLGILMMFSTAMAFAQAPSSSPSAGAPAGGTQDRGSDKLDLKKLEEKYWSAKDTDFAVVQNRTYAKEKRYYVSLSYGPLMNDPYSIGRMTSLSVGYFLSERSGVELNLEGGALKDNDSTSFYKNTYRVNPDYNIFNNYKSINYVIVPFYAKMSFWNRSIIYFDIGFAAGIGQMTYTQQVDPVAGGDVVKSTMGFNLDITQQLFFHRHWAIRFDIKNKFTTQERLKYSFGAGDGPGRDRSMGNFSAQDTSILLGATYFF